MRTTTWTSIGTDVNTTSVNEALSQAKLDYEVTTTPIYALADGKNIELPDKVATIRKDTNEILGVVSTRYRVCQNKDAFDFVDSIEGVNIVKAGQTHTGMVYMIGKLPEVTVLGDIFTPYVIFQNGHNGIYTVKTTICPLRHVCQNQFNMSFRNSPNTISIQHSKQLGIKIAEAHKVIAKTASYMKNFGNTAEELAMLKIGNDANVKEIINAFFNITEDATNRQIVTITEQRNELFNAYKADDNANFTGTAWGLINGFSDYITHREGKNTKNKDEGKFMTVTFDPKIFAAFMAHVQNYTA